MARYLSPTVEAWHTRVVAAHPQLRDLLVVADQRVITAATRGLEVLNLSSCTRDSFASTGFVPNCLTSGRGLVVAGGPSAELAIRPIDADPEDVGAWAQANFAVGLSINNSCRITPSPHAGAHSRLHVSNNDQSIHVYDLIAPRDRTDEADDDDEDVLALDARPFAGPRSRTLPVLERHAQLRFPTAINACDISPDGRYLIAVGDSPSVWLYAVSSNGQEYTHVRTLDAADDAGFSVSWSPDSRQFAVATQDGHVTIWDLRQCLSSPSHFATGAPYKLAVLKTHQHAKVDGSGAARIVRFSPGSERLLAFTEQSGFASVVDARTLDEATVVRLEVPRAPVHGDPPAAAHALTSNFIPDGSSTGRYAYSRPRSILRPEYDPPARSYPSSSPGQARRLIRPVASRTSDGHPAAESAASRSLASFGAALGEGWRGAAQGQPPRQSMRYSEFEGGGTRTPGWPFLSNSADDALDWPPVCPEPDIEIHSLPSSYGSVEMGRPNALGGAARAGELTGLSWSQDGRKFFVSAEFCVAAWTVSDVDRFCSPVTTVL